MVLGEALPSLFFTIFWRFEAKSSQRTGEKRIAKGILKLESTALQRLLPKQTSSSIPSILLPSKHFKFAQILVLLKNHWFWVIRCWIEQSAKLCLAQNVIALIETSGFRQGAATPSLLGWSNTQKITKVLGLPAPRLKTLALSKALWARQSFAPCSIQHRLA